VQGMEEFLSAANLRITISESEDATLDYFSVREMVSPGVVLAQGDHLSFVCPKIAPNGRIELEFDTFTPKTGSVGVATVLAEFVDENGKKSIHRGTTPICDWRTRRGGRNRGSDNSEVHSRLLLRSA